MNKDQREIQRKLRILRYAEEIGHVSKACRYFGIGRSSFYRWRQAYAERGEAGLVCSSYPQMAREQNASGTRGKGDISSSQIPPRSHADRLVS